MSTLLTIIALAFMGCSGRPTTPVDTKAPDPREIDVLASLLSQDYNESIRRKSPLVIEDAFSIAMLRMGGDSHEKFTTSLLSQASDDVPADLIRDFCAKNAEPQKVWPELGQRLPVILLSRQDLKSLFSASHQEKPDGWIDFTPSIRSLPVSSPSRGWVSIAGGTWRWFT